MNKSEIDNFIVEVITKIKKQEVSLEERIMLSSLETLRCVSELERKYNIEFDDKLIFRGLFDHISTVRDYIIEKCAKC